MADKKEDLETEVVTETAAQDSVKTKSGAMADFISKMQGMSHDDITKLSDVFKTVDNNDAAAPDNADKNRATISAKTVKEDLALIFGDDGKELSEKFLDDVATLFESVVSMRVAVEREKMFEEAAEIVEEMVAEQVQELEESLDSYLEATVEDWLEENKLAVESSLRLNQMESFFEGLRGLFEDHNIDIPEEELDVVDGLMEEVEELKEKLNAALNENLEYRELIEDAKAEQIFDEISEGLAATQVEKLRALTEGLEYQDLDQYKEKVTLIKEANFKTNKPTTSSLEEEVVPQPEVKTAASNDPVMNRYAAAISKDLKR